MLTRVPDLGPDLIAKADAFATVAHAGLLRKYTFEPYIFHPRAVAKLVKDVGLPDTVVAAALLHDVIEDTFRTVYDLRMEFGDEVTALVIEVTEVAEKGIDGNRAKRKAKDLRHFALASAYGQSIKVADLIDNTKSIVAHDPDFAKVYLKEKRALLDALTKAHPVLLRMAWAALVAGEKKLELAA